MKYDVITIGSAVRDTFLFVDPADAPVIANPNPDPKRKKLIALEQGAKIDVVSSARTIGGGGANAAVTFSRMGLKAAAMVRVGNDEAGRVVARTLASEGIATRFVQRDPKLPTAFSTLIVAGSRKRDRVVLTERGASKANNFSPAARSAAKTKWYCTSALSGRAWKNELRDISKTAKAHNISWAWNPGSVQLKAGLSGVRPFMKICSVFNVNRDEALELTGAANNPKALLGALVAAGPERVLLSDGPAGVYYADAGGMLHMAADPRIKALEPTGAGDALLSGFIAGLIAKNDVAYALDLGLANSESVICKIGAQAGILRPSELAAALKKQNHKLSHA
ncbi:MAG: carbohydrate kinase family protein [Parcubacteria group bacterium]|nr:carbohydrate kinase family protein [Parcubacteria group bacterium]